ncbi:hypothetical protein [Chitinophaga sp. CF418]|uniref:hypothetical protein n=1 Tax=Chitinophaga sp. CF418 TaxID=1855287 RepID=UPI0009226BB6|nr:hypothetical protein [Chitinophaga sp. CF418]SHN45774.1 hypothetical protein SAMN05216311_12175 [Chitinophaga sp. CF418]
MHIELKLPCGCKPIDLDPTKHNADIVAMPAFWWESYDVECTLCSPPVPGETYKVQLHSPLSIDLYQKRWLYYEGPNAHYNGFDTAEDIESIRFCYGQISAILDIAEHHVLIEFKVEESLSHKDILNTHSTTTRPVDWSGTFSADNKHNTRGSKLGPYYVFYFSAQGDLGTTVIAVEEDNKMYVLFLYNWVMHERAYYAGKYLADDTLRAFSMEHCE